MQETGDQIVDQRPKDVPPARVPDFVTFNPGLKGPSGALAVRLYAVLDRHVTGKGRSAFPGWRVLTVAMKCSNNGVKVAIKGLERIRAVRVDRKKKGPKGRAPNIYYLLPIPSRVPPEWKGHKPSAKEALQMRLLSVGEQPCSPRENYPALPGSAERLKDLNAVSSTALKSQSKKAEIMKICAQIEDFERTLEKDNLPEKHRAGIKAQVARLEDRLGVLRGLP